MQVTMTTPAPLVGQSAGQLIDVGLAGIARGAGPTGALGSTITVPFALFYLLTSLGFTFSSWTPG